MMCFFTSMETRQSCIQDTTEYMRPSRSPTYLADFVKIASQNLPTLLIGSLNPFQHLERPTFSQCSELRKKTCCLPSCRELPAPCQNPLFSPPSKIPHSQSPGTSLARVSALLETGGKCVMWEKPFSVEESSFRMALGRKAG